MTVRRPPPLPPPRLLGMAVAEETPSQSERAEPAATSAEPPHRLTPQGVAEPEAEGAAEEKGDCPKKKKHHLEIAG